MKCQGIGIYSTELQVPPGTVLPMALLSRPLVTAAGLDRHPNLLSPKFKSYS